MALLRKTHLLCLLVSLNLAVPEPASAQFNPAGRTRKKPRAKPSRQPRATPKPARPPEASKAALIRRYQAIVLSQPGAQFPLQRLADLYRERDGNLDQLVAEFELRAQKSPANYNTLVALAGVYKQAQKIDLALSSYQRAIAKSPNKPEALLALGHLHQDRGDKQQAKQQFERALPHITVGADKEQTLRLLLALSLDSDDIQAARSYHKQLVRRAKGSFFARAELGRELLARRKYALAEIEYRKIVKAAAGDNRALAPALRDLGRTLAKQNKREEALATLRRALRITGAQSGLRREIFDLVVDVYRDNEQLTELVRLLEDERATDFARLRLLGGLYEETGRINQAVKTYRRALGKKPKDLEVRLRLVQLLQIQGELEQAVEEYRALIRSAPHNPDFVFQLAEALLQRGDRKGALKELKRLERRAGTDEQTIVALVEFYERVGAPTQGMQLLQKLATSGTRDPQHIVELGNRYFQAGETEKAKRTWKRILNAVPNRARALNILGEVYLEHDMAEQALEALAKASQLAPKQIRYKKAYALALERTGAGASKRTRFERYEAARRIWEELLRASNNQRHLEREARQHIVTLWSLGGTLKARVRPLERNLRRTPPDLSSGRLLAEVYLRLRQYPQAERVLTQVVKHAPGDAASYLRLERVLVLQRKLRDAIHTLSRLVTIEPKRAREYYQRMAQYSAELYRDDDAIRYAAKAVELSPDDASGHQKLGDMYRWRQDTERAIAEYRKAIRKNSRLFPVYFELAQLLLGQGESDEADRLLRRVMRAAHDEELIARATRLSTQINLGKGSLESLERELLPVALANPQKPIYRRLLVEIYGALAFPLVQKTQAGDAEQAALANSELRRIGQRAVKPLLDALGDVRSTQQRVAIELLAFLQNQSATAALFAYATGEAAPTLQVRAMIAAGAPKDESMLARFGELILPSGIPRVDEGNPVSLAAAWGIARLRSTAAQKAKLKLLESDAPTARALAAISLALTRARGATRAIHRMLDAGHQDVFSQAAAAFALGELGKSSSLARLELLAQSTDDRVRAQALVALARLGAARSEINIAEALVHGDATLRTAAHGAAIVLAGAPYDSQRDPLSIPTGGLDMNEVLANLYPRRGSADAEAHAIISLADELTAAVRTGIQSSTERAQYLADALMARGDKPAFGELSVRLAQVQPKLRAQAEAALRKVATAAVQPFISLSSHPAASVRTASLRFLGTIGTEPARQAIASALDDVDPQVQRAALTALAQSPDASTLTVVSTLLEPEHAWPIRVHATETLAAFAKLRGTPGLNFARVTLALTRLAQEDEYSLVREAAIKTLHLLLGESARSTLHQVAKTDPEPLVRQTAKKLLQ